MPENRCIIIQKIIETAETLKECLKGKISVCNMQIVIWMAYVKVIYGKMQDCAGDYSQKGKEIKFYIFIIF